MFLDLSPLGSPPDILKIFTGLLSHITPKEGANWQQCRLHPSKLHSINTNSGRASTHQKDEGPAATDHSGVWAQTWLAAKSVSTALMQQLKAH